MATLQSSVLSSSCPKNGLQSEGNVRRKSPITSVCLVNAEFEQSYLISPCTPSCRPNMLQFPLRGPAPCRLASADGARRYR